MGGIRLQWGLKSQWQQGTNIDFAFCFRLFEAESHCSSPACLGLTM